MRDFKSLQQNGLYDIQAYPKAEIGCCIDLNLQESMIIVLYKYRFWQDKAIIELTTNEMIEQQMNYIHENPVRQVLLLRRKTTCSSARKYAGLSIVIEIDRYENYRLLYLQTIYHEPLRNNQDRLFGNEGEKTTFQHSLFV